MRSKKIILFCLILSILVLLFFKLFIRVSKGYNGHGKYISEITIFFEESNDANFLFHLTQNRELGKELIRFKDSIDVLDEDGNILKAKIMNGIVVDETSKTFVILYVYLYDFKNVYKNNDHLTICLKTEKTVSKIRLNKFNDWRFRTPHFVAH